MQVDTIRETVDWRMAAFAERMDEKLGSVATDVAATVSEAGDGRRRRDGRARSSAGVGAIDGVDSLDAPRARPRSRNACARTSTTA